MPCDDIRSALAAFGDCVETSDGARVTTHCLYPSFDPVAVFVSRYGDGFKVHDGGGANRSAWIHGRDEALITRMLARQATRYQIAATDGTLVCDVTTADWLAAAILTVANASASAAHLAVDRIVTASEVALKERIQAVLFKALPRPCVEPDYKFTGRSGKTHEFDFAIKSSNDTVLLIDAVAPHHISIAAKYVAFADTKLEGGDALTRFAVFDRPLEQDDVSLLQQVADLVPFKALEPGVRRVLRYA